MEKQQTTTKEKKYRSQFLKFGKFILTSAPFALLLSIIFFWVENSKNEEKFNKTIENFNKIEQSLSTRHIGIFPNYLPQINELLKDVNPETSIIIFQDVLYYGIFSDPNGFKKLISRIIGLSEKCSVCIAYYDINGRAFRRSVQESRIKQEYIGKIDRERLALVSKFRVQYADSSGINIYQKADSIVSEKYFAFSRNDADFKGKMERYLTPLYDAKNDKDSLFFKIDEIKRKNIGKPIQSITFYDFYKMYHDISEQLIDVFRRHNIELIGVNESHVMSCWLNGDKAILAFPSKYASKEIGFSTQDPIFSEYIHTMLEGVKNQIE